MKNNKRVNIIFLILAVVLILILIFIFFFKDNININSPSLEDDIVINYNVGGPIAHVTFDQVQKETSYDDIIKMFLIKNPINIPANVKFNSSGCFYERERDEQGNLIGKSDDNSVYTKLSSCRLYFYNNDESTISIWISKNQMPIIDYWDVNDLKKSLINNVEVIIINYKGENLNTFLVTFNNDNYFYIETENIEETELINLLKSMA